MLVWGEELGVAELTAKSSKTIFRVHTVVKIHKFILTPKKVYYITIIFLLKIFMYFRHLWL